jgi:hypothetical protein
MFFRSARIVIGGRSVSVFSTGTDSPVRADSSIRSSREMEAQVRRDLVAGLKEDDVAGHELRRGNGDALPVPEKPSKRWPSGSSGLDARSALSSWM